MNDFSEHPRLGAALLIDGENLSARHASTVLAQARRHGPLVVTRVYGNAALINGWNDAPGLRVIHSGSGKNAADILLAIDAIDLSYGGQVGSFVLASGDNDFSHLAHRLREAGFRVIGIGEDKAGLRFRSACTAFHALEQLVSEGGPSELSALDRQIYEVIVKQTGRRDMPLTDLNAVMRRTYDVRISSRPERTWRSYLRSKPDLYRCDDKGPDARVHLLA